MESSLSEVVLSQKHIKQKSPSNFSCPPHSLFRPEFYSCQCVFYFTKINVIMYLKPGIIFPLWSYLYLGWTYRFLSSATKPLDGTVLFIAITWATFSKERQVHTCSIRATGKKKQPTFHCLNYVSSAHGKKLLYLVSSQRGADMSKIENNSGCVGSGGRKQQGAGGFCRFWFQCLQGFDPQIKPQRKLQGNFVIIAKPFPCSRRQRKGEGGKAKPKNEALIYKAT